jgi:hypothetical protein
MCVWSQLTAALLFFRLLAVAQAPPSSATAQIHNPSLEPAQQSGKWGYVDPTGKFLIPPQYDSADSFSEGTAVVELSNRFGYVDKDGHFVIQPKYFKAGPFRGGFAWVVTRKPLTPFGTGEYGFALLGQVTYIDHSGRELRRPFFAEHVSNFSEGLAAVRPGKISGGCSEKVGYLNTKGDWSIRPQFDEGRDFSEGLAAVNQGGKCHMGGKWGYVDKDGMTVIPTRYDYAGQFETGHACVEEAGQWKLIDTKGNGVSVEKAGCSH